MGNPCLKDTNPQLMKIGRLGYLAVLNIPRVVRFHLLYHFLWLSERNSELRIVNDLICQDLNL